MSNTTQGHEKNRIITFVLLADLIPGPWLKVLNKGSSAGSLSGCSRYSLVLNESLISSKQCISSYVCELEKMTWARKGEKVKKYKQDDHLTFYKYPWKNLAFDQKSQMLLRLVKQSSNEI